MFTNPVKGAKDRRMGLDMQALEPRRPKQARSRARLAAILDAAEGLVAEVGVSGLTMSAVAEKAGVSIGSLYQYTPTMQALMRALAERFLDRWRGYIEEALASEAPDAMGEGVAHVIRRIYAEMRERPERRDIWRHLVADRDLAALDLADSRANAKRITGLLVERGVIAKGDADATEREVLLIAHLSGAATQLAGELPEDEGDAIVESFIAMARHRLGIDPAP